MSTKTDKAIPTWGEVQNSCMWKLVNNDRLEFDTTQSTFSESINFDPRMIVAGYSYLINVNLHKYTNKLQNFSTPTTVIVYPIINTVISIPYDIFDEYATVANNTNSRIYAYNGNYESSEFSANPMQIYFNITGPTSTSDVGNNKMRFSSLNILINNNINMESTYGTKYEVWVWVYQSNNLIL